ncbi:aminotransferase-like domain-containing protein [Desulfocurvus sp. DL9XJH121]
MTIQLRIPTASRDPKYSLIADAIEEAVAQGRLAPGQALPTHRALAGELSVTVGTVTRAYAEAARRGLVRGERGRGTFVSAPIEGFAGLGKDQGVVDMGLAATTHSLGPALAATLADMARDPNLAALLTRHESRGLPRHREAGARWAGRFRYPARADDVLVCAGAQHALYTCLAGLFSPGDKVAVEALTYPMVKPMAQRLCLTLVPLPMDEGGLVPEALAEACARDHVRGLYTMPTCNNPTVARMPEYRRHEVADVCRRHGVRIVEDDVYALAVGASLPPLSALAPELGHFIASTSKVLCDGLRVAFLCVPPGAVASLEAALAMTSWKAAGLMAEIAARWIDDGTADATIEANHKEARVRVNLARDILGAERLAARDTGSFVWLRLPPGWGSVDFAEATARRGAVVAHQEHFAVGATRGGQGVRVSLSGVRDRAALARGLGVLAETLRLGEGR